MKRQGLHRLFTAGVIATSLLASSTAAFASDIFLKIDKIQGESQDSKHKNEIEVLSWSWGQSTGTAQVGRGNKLPATCIQDLHFTKFIDSSSPALIMNSVLGEVAQSAVLTVRKPSGDQKQSQEFLKLTMKNVTVVSFQTGGADGAVIPLEQVTLNFESIQGEYRKQRADGTLDAPIMWDIAGGKAACQQ